MHKLVLSVAMLVWIFADPSVHGALSISFEGSKEEHSTTYSLKCEIPSFSSLAGWSRDGSPIATCTTSGCNPSSDASYTFRNTASAIHVDFNTLAKSENGIQWMCEHIGDTSVTFDVQIDISPATSLNFESSSIIEYTSTSIFVETNAGISPTYASQLNTVNSFSVSSDADNILLSSIATSDRKHPSASFKTENFETINATNASFFMHTSSSVPNSLLTNMSLIPNLDSYKTNIQSSMINTETVSPLTVTIESDYQPTFDSILTEFTNSLLTSGLYITTSEISSDLIYSALKSSFSVTTEVYPISTYTDTVSTGTITSDQMFDMKETTAITPITAANVFSRNSLSDDIPLLQTTFDSITSSGSTIHQFMPSLLTSTAMFYSITSISEEAGFSSSLTLEAPRSTNTVLTADEYGSMMTSKLVYENTSAFELASRIIPTNRQSSAETPLDSYYSVNTFRSFSTTHEETFMNTLDQSFIKTESDMGLFTSSLVNSNFLLSPNATSNYFKEASDSQFALSDSELSDTSSTVISEKGDVSTTPLSYSSIMDTVKHTSNFFTSHFNEHSVSVIQNSILSSITISTLIQTSSVTNNENAENTYTERHSSLQTMLFSSMTDTITETVTSAYDDKVILLTSSEQMLLVTSSLNTLESFTSGMENSVFSTESFVKIISRPSNEFATSSSSLDTFSPKYVKTTTPFQHGLSESTKDDIFISAVSGMIGAIIFVVLIAMFISRFIMNRNKSKNEKDDETSNQYGWSDDAGMNSYNKNYTSREYPFNSTSSIHLPLPSYESPYFSYANNYKKNWDDNT